MSDARWTAIILAGQRPGENDFGAAHGVAAKALIPVGGIPMLGRVTRTLLTTPAIGRIVVLAQAPEALLTGTLEWMAAEPRIVCARSHGGISTSILGVAGEANAPWPVLVVTADHALLTPAIVAQFIARSGGADAAVGVVERRVIELAYPETRRTWLRFRGGAYSGANLFALSNARARQALAIWAEVERDRKNAAKLLTRFGPWLAIRALTRTITLDAALAEVGHRAGLSVKAVRLDAAEAAIDVDKQADLDLAEQILAGRRAISR